MKKTYIIPTMESVKMAQTLPIASSQPSATINRNGNVDADKVEVKGTTSYDVWDDDWSK